LGILAILAHHNTVNEQKTNTGMPKILCCACNCGVQTGKKFSIQNKECVNISISIILPVFAHTSYAIKYADSNRKNCTRNKIPNLSYGVAAVSTSFHQSHY
jgi:hypothetical protein